MVSKIIALESSYVIHSGPHARTPRPEYSHSDFDTWRFWLYQHPKTRNVRLNLHMERSIDFGHFYKLLIDDLNRKSPNSHLPAFRSAMNARMPSASSAPAAIPTAQRNIQSPEFIQFVSDLGMAF